MQQMAAVYSLNEDYAFEAQGLLINELEGDLAALWSSLTTTAVGDTSNGVTDANIREAVSTLDSADFDINEIAFFFHPEVFWTQLHGISKYYTDDTANLMLHVDGNFGAVADTSRGLRGALFGIPIFVSSNIVESLGTYRNLLLHPRSMAFGIHNEGTVDTEFGATAARIRVQAEYELRNLATLSVADILYGTGILRADAGVVINSSNDFVTS